MCVSVFSTLFLEYSCNLFIFFCLVLDSRHTHTPKDVARIVLLYWVTSQTFSLTMGVFASKNFICDLNVPALNICEYSR